MVGGGGHCEGWITWGIEGDGNGGSGCRRQHLVGMQMKLPSIKRAKNNRYCESMEKKKYQSTEIAQQRVKYTIQYNHDILRHLRLHKIDRNMVSRTCKTNQMDQDPTTLLQNDYEKYFLKNQF